ncbi:MAG: hypothetical protein RJA22_534 [Verrucomicrobiota bacterium]|jgi:hypothetical protein
MMYLFPAAFVFIPMKMSDFRLATPRMCFVWVTLLLLGLPLAGRAQILINEVLAANQSTAPLVDIPDYFPDYIELYNFSTNDIDLGLEGYCLTDDIRFPTKFRFPLGTVIAADSFLLVFCDAETNLVGAEGVLHTGFGLDAKGGETLAIYRTNVGLNSVTFICSNYFGIQVPGYSVGRIPSAQGDPNSSASFTLNIPTPCGVPYPVPSQPCLPNVAASFVPAPTSSNQFTLKINEWMATNSAGVDQDWIEIYNPDTNIVLLSGLVFIDNGLNSPAGPFLLQTIRAVPALSFIGPRSYVQFFASDLASRDANHLDFGLSSGSDTAPPAPGVPLDRIYLFGPSRTPASLIDKVDCFLWRGRNLSEGRVPDGENRFIVFPNPTPEESNFGRITNVVIQELLSHTDPPLEDAVKFYNPTPSPVDISYWWLSNTRDNPRKYQYPAGTVIQPFSYLVTYESQINDLANHPATAFNFNSARGDECYLFSADAQGVLTGFRTGVTFGPADNGVSFVRYVTSDTNAEFVAATDLGFGTDVRAGQDPARLAVFRTGQGATNAPPTNGPVVINEIHYHPPDVIVGGIPEDNAVDEFVELRNISPGNVPLFYAPRDQSPEQIQYATNGWRLRGLVDFDFPGLDTGRQYVMPPNSYVLMVNFDPDALTNAVLRGQFMARFNVPPGTKMFGPYRKRLSNNSGEVQLQRPDQPQAPGRPDAGLTPYVRIDRVVYNDRAPWPTNGVDGGGHSIQRRFSYEFGNDPTNWFGAAPTPGNFNSPTYREAPYILAQPISPGIVEPGTTVELSCLARGDLPITYRWYRNGFFTGVTGNTLDLVNIGSLQVGDYTCLISNIAGITTSRVARVDVDCPFTLNHPLAGFPIDGGSSNIVVTGRPNCTWSVINTAAWVNVTSGPLYTGSDVVTYTVQPNLLGVRSATLIVAGLPYVVGQTPADLTRPTVGVTAPAANARVTSPALVVRGSLKDNVQIGPLAGAVSVQVGTGVAQQFDGSNAWSAGVTLSVPGTNTLRVWAQDFAGNYSFTNTRTVFYAIPSTLYLARYGSGTVAGATNLQRLDLGRNYTLSATPGTGYVLSHWSLNGNPVSGSNRLTFRMEAGLSVGAHFVENPYVAVKGSYDGLLFTAGDAHHTNAALFKMTTTDKGTYSVTLQMAGKRYSASGQFLIDPTGSGLPSATNVIARTGLSPLTVKWDLDTVFDSDTVTGFAWLQESPLPITVIGNRAIYSATVPAPLAGKYTVLLPGTPGAPDRPEGAGFGTVSVSSSGVITFSGTLADGSRVSQSVPVSQNGEWPLYVNLYAGKGSLLGWVYFATNNPVTDLSGELVWTRPAQAGAFYPAGFEAASILAGSRYVAPAATGRILDLPNGFVTLTGGNLGQAYTDPFTLGPGSKFTNNGPNTLSITFTTSSGLFTGSFKPAGSTTSRTLKGAVLQKANIGAGFFPGTNEVGLITLEPPPPPVEE